MVAVVMQQLFYWVTKAVDLDCGEMGGGTRKTHSPYT